MMQKFLALKYILNFHNKEKSINALMRKGDDDASFISAAQESGFNTKEIEDETLSSFGPFIIKTNMGYLVVIEVKDEKVYLYNPKDEIEDVLSLQKVKDIYEKTILIKPRLHANKTLSSIAYRIDPKKWITDIIKVNISSYKKVFVLAILINLVGLLSPMYIRVIYDRVLPNAAIDTLMVFSIGIIFVYLFDLVMKNVRSHYVENAAKKFDMIISQNIFDHLMQIKLSQKPKSTGIFVNSVLSYATLREFFSSSIILVLIDLPFSLLFIAVIFSLVSTAGWIVVGVSTSLILASAIFYPILKSTSESSFNEDRIKHGVLVESIYALEIIRAINATKRMFLKYNENMQKSTDAHKRHTHYTHLLNDINNFITQTGYVLLVAFSVGLFFQKTDGVTPGSIFAAMILYRMATNAFLKLSTMIGKLSMIYLSYKSAENIFAIPREQDREHIITKENFNGDITFKDVSFSYEGQANPILKNFNLSIKKGERVAMLGKIGSGKSTISKLILNLYQPQEGSILIDGINIKQIEPLDLRSNIGYVPQDVMLFNGTLKENIALGSNHFLENEKVNYILKTVGLDHIVTNSQEGLDMVIGERGDTLSGGEKQALSIARALVNYPPILVFDEATKSMDSMSEKEIINNLEHIIEDKTTIIVTHKPSMLKLATRIIVIEEGKIVLDEPKDIALEKLGMNNVSRV